MANKVYDESNISAIADAIRSKTGGTEKYYTSEMADGVAEVYEAGKKAEYDAFWEGMQRGGFVTNYAAMFGAAWSAVTFKPKYDITIVTGAYAFAFNSLGGDLVEYFEKLGRKLDLTQAANVGNMFQASQFTRIGNFCCPAGGWWNTFNGCTQLETIDEWGKPTEDEEITGGGLTGCFTGCTALKNIKVRGKIADNINFQWCPLSYDSIVNIKSHLSDTTQWMTLTLSKAAVNKAFETGASSNDGSTSPEWLALVASKPNWTISLA